MHYPDNAGKRKTNVLMQYENGRNKNKILTMDVAIKAYTVDAY